VTETGQTNGNRRTMIIAGIGVLAVLLAISGAVAFGMKSPASPDAPSTVDALGAKDAARQGRIDTHTPVIQVCYFHRTMRCPSCEKIEFLAKRAVEEAFASELASGGMQWRSVNIDEPENKHFEDDYRLPFQSIIVSEWREGKETRWKNLEKVWDLLNNDAEFIRYVRDEIRAYTRHL